MKLYLALLVAILGNCIYHMGQKSLPKGLDPMVSISLAYFVALTLSLAGVVLMKGDFSELGRTVVSLPWAVVAIGVGATLVEIGFLLAYRFGGPMTVSSLMVNTTVALILAPVGVALYGERITRSNVAGILLCLIGLALIAWQGEGSQGAPKSDNLSVADQ